MKQFDGIIAKLFHILGLLPAKVGDIADFGAADWLASFWIALGENDLGTTVTQTMSIAFLRKISVALGVPLYAFFLERPVKNPGVR